MEIQMQKVRKGGIRVTAVVGEEFAATVASVLENLDAENANEFLKRLNWALGSKPINETTKCVVLYVKSMLFGLTSAEQLVKYLVGRMKVGAGARFVMSQSSFVISQKPEQATFVELSLSDLGFTSDVKTEDFMTKEFCQKWSAKNLRRGRIGLCDIGDAVQFRLHHISQPEGETLWFATKRFKDDMGHLSVFQVLCDKHNQKWIATKPAPDGALWDKRMKVVFRYYYDATHES